MRSTESIGLTVPRGVSGSAIQTTSNPNQKHYLIQPPGGWRVGSRLSHFDYGGYVPIGFFQMWNRASTITRYPTTQDAGAEHTDVLHGLQWPRPDRILIPEIIAVHLESEPCAMGANWKGRITKQFGPESRTASATSVATAPRTVAERSPDFLSAGHEYAHGK